MVAIGFILVLLVDAALLMLVAAVFPDWLRVPLVNDEFEQWGTRSARWAQITM
jgi:hypothetical protein